MHAFINFYASQNVTPSAQDVLNCLNFLSPTSIRISRTIGPDDRVTRSQSGNNSSAWWALLFSGWRRGSRRASARRGIPRDVSDERIDDLASVPGYLRENSVLSVSIDRSPFVGKLVEDINSSLPEDEQFFWSDFILRFGPFEVGESYEDDDGEPGLRLVAKTNFTIFISCDNFPGRLPSLQTAIESAPSFSELKAFLETLFGPMRLHLRYL